MTEKPESESNNLVEPPGFTMEHRVPSTETPGVSLVYLGFSVSKGGKGLPSGARNSDLLANPQVHGFEPFHV